MPAAATYLLLGAAIAAEVVATTALARTDGFTRPWPSLLAVSGYALAFWMLSHGLKVMPTGIVYWPGLGVVLIARVAWVWDGQRLDVPALIGLALIVAGVIPVNGFSKSVSH